MYVNATMFYLQSVLGTIITFCKYLCETVNRYLRLNLQKKIATKKLSSDKELKPFYSIPGPISLPVIGCLYKYLPFIGEYSFLSIYGNVVKRYKKYGTIARECTTPGVNVLYVFDPEDVKAVLKNSGKYPERMSFTALMNYRRSKPNLYNSAGIAPTNGEEWYKVRSVYQKPLSSPRTIFRYLGNVDTAVNELIDRIKGNYVGKKEDEEYDFFVEIMRVFLQVLMMIMFDIKIDTFSEKELKKGSLSSKLMYYAMKVTDLTLPLDMIPSIFHCKLNPLYKKICESFEFIERFAIDCLSKKMSNTNKGSNQEVNYEPSLLEIYLSYEDTSDLLSVLVDLLIAGFETTSVSSSFVLYHLSRNPCIQQKLYEESLVLLPDKNNEINEEVLSSATYLKAVVKESMRLNPVALGIGRTLTQDMELSGYHIPSDTIVIMCTQILGVSETYFDHPESFIPERWIKDSEHFKIHNQFTTVPFGHGSRTCIGKRIAEQNLHIFILKMIRNFEISWTRDDLKIDSTLINRPSGPLKFSFKLRND